MPTLCMDPGTAPEAEPMAAATGVAADATVPVAVSVATFGRGEGGIVVDVLPGPDALGADDSFEALAFTSATMAWAASALLPVRR